MQEVMNPTAPEKCSGTYSWEQTRIKILKDKLGFPRTAIDALALGKKRDERVAILGELLTAANQTIDAWVVRIRTLAEQLVAVDDPRGDELLYELDGRLLARERETVTETQNELIEMLHRVEVIVKLRDTVLKESNDVTPMPRRFMRRTYHYRKQNGG